MMNNAVANHKKRSNQPRNERRQAGSRGSHLGCAPIAVDEYVVQYHVQQVGEYHDYHRDGRIADTLQKLFEGGKQHKR